MTPEETIARQVDTYNASDLDGYMALFHEDAAIYDFPGIPLMKGRAEIRARYSEIFKKHPENCMILHKRIVLGARILDYETVYRNGLNEDGFTVMTVYDVKNGQITRVEFIRTVS